MNIAFVLVALSTIWLNSCVAFHKKNTQRDDFSKMWGPVIDYLNQEGSEQGMVADDLVQIYDNELALIEKALMVQKSSAQEKNAIAHEQISAQNRRAVASLTTPTLARDDVVTIAAEVLRAVEAHPIASSKNTLAYDGGDQIGFCFARALLVHYLLLRAGLSQNDLVKVFALGDFYLGGQFWRFHVAMMIKTTDGLLMVDPLYGELVYLDAWMDNVASLDVKKPMSRARFYLTDPRKFMPSTGFYDVALFTPAEIKPYFTELGQSLER